MSTHHVPETAAEVAPFLAAYAAAKAGLPGHDDARVAALREAAIARFAEAGLPSRRIEAWKYTDLRRLARHGPAARPAAPSAPEQALPDALAALDADRLVFVDGRHAPALSSAPGADTARPLSALLEGGAAPGELLEAGTAARNHAGHAGLIALNTAMAGDGLVLEVPPGVALDRPVLAVHSVTAAAQTSPRTVLRLGAGAEAELIEVFRGAPGAAGWTNAVAETQLEPGARLRHVVVIDQAPEGFHTGLAAVELGCDADYRGLVQTVGGRIVRHEVSVRLAGPGAACRLSGGALVDGRRHVDHTTEIVHAVPHTTSDQAFRNVVDDHGRSVFQGRVVVEADAQKTDAAQSARSLLLSEAAEADNKPELRIFADDVKCSHGAAVGDLDAEALFYLRARGIPEAEARAMLVRAFVAGLFERVPVAAARSFVEAAVDGWLARHAGTGEAR